MTAIVSRERTLRRAALIGMLWGVGHSLTVLAVGGMIVAFRLVIPPRLALGLEFVVALMLILLGFANLRHRHEEAAPPAGTWRPLLVGTVHGLAGSAAVALLVLATITETTAALAYLAVFGVGTIVGMMVVTVMLAAPALYAAGRVHRMQRGIRLAAGTLSVLFGVMLARELVVEGGLFSETPTWEAR